MAKDTIFRIASQSKAITSVGIMMLIEDGRLLLGDPVSKYIPAFTNTTVRGTASAGSVNPVVAKRPITIRDLLTHTAGVSYGGEPDLQAVYSAAGFTQWYFADKAEPIGFWIEKLATLPFEAQPGERFVYGYSTDILGYVIEKVSGQPLDRFLASRIFEPLKMVDTHFFLPNGKAGRLATVYGRPSGGALTRAPEGHPGQGLYVKGPRAAFSGGAGLLSTAGDYARFLQMMLNGGELDGVRLLSPKTVELMTVNHIGTLYPTAGRGFGLGFETVDDLGRSGRYGSEGAAGGGVHGAAPARWRKRSAGKTARAGEPGDSRPATPAPALLGRTPALTGPDTTNEPCAFAFGLLFFSSLLFDGLVLSCVRGSCVAFIPA
jgi:CubicO group peptidase (beta-lactamase class C family)